MDLVVSTDVPCPWCGEYYETSVDTSQGDFETIEDCAVCCRPITLRVTTEPGEIFRWKRSAARSVVTHDTQEPVEVTMCSHPAHHLPRR